MTALGRPGDDLRGERGTDLVRCGRGADIVDEPKRGEWLERGCDAIRYSFVTLTPLGRRLARRAGGVDVTATVAGRGLPTRSWTFPLRAR